MTPQSGIQENISFLIPSTAFINQYLENKVRICIMSAIPYKIKIN